jgi:serine/threonine protein kinase
MPPEQLRIMKSEEKADHGCGSIKSEIFSAGCVFIFFLLRGKHPFGDESNNIPKNVLRGDPINVKGS